MKLGDMAKLKAILTPATTALRTILKYELSYRKGEITAENFANVTSKIVQDMSYICTKNGIDLDQVLKGV